MSTSRVPVALDRSDKSHDSALQRSTIDSEWRFVQWLTNEALRRLKPALERPERTGKAADTRGLVSPGVDREVASQP